MRISCLCVLSLAGAFTLGLLCSEPTFAEPNLKLSLQLITDNLYDDNATRLSGGEGDQVGERQFLNSIAINGSYASDFLSASSNYQFSDNGFTRDSLEDQSILIGQSQIQLFKPDDRFSLTIDQNQQRSLVDTEDQILIQNTQRRSSFGIAPRVNLNPSSVTQATVSGRAEFVRNEIVSNSETLSANIALNRSLSKVVGLGTELGFRVVSIDDAPQFDYRVVNAGLRYQSRLRQSSLNIGIGVGSLSSESNNDQNSIVFDLSYSRSVNRLRFGLTASREFSDAANLDGIQVDELGLIVGQQQVGSLVSSRVATTLGIVGLCTHCDLNFLTSFQRVIGVESDVNDSEVLSFNTSFSYDISPHSRINLLYSLNDTEFLNDSDRFSQQDMIRLTFQRTLTRHIDGSIYFSHTNFEALSEDFERNIIGVRFTYGLGTR